MSRKIKIITVHDWAKRQFADNPAMRFEEDEILILDEQGVEIAEPHREPLGTDYIHYRDV